MGEDVTYEIIDEQPPKRKRGRPKGTKGGRPSKKTNLDFNLVRRLYSAGFTNEELAEILGITTTTLDNWKKDELFLGAIKDGKYLPDQKVVRSLYELATGYEYEEDDIRVIDKEVVVTRVKRKAIPNVTACIYWTKNRMPDKWREKHNVELGGKDGGPVTMKVIYEEKEQPSQKEGK